MLKSIKNYLILKNQKKRLENNIFELKQKGVKDNQIMYLNMMLDILKLEKEYYRNRIFTWFIILSFIFIIGITLKIYYGI